MSCVDSRRSSHPSSYILCRIQKLKLLPLSRCLLSARGDCERIVLRSCRIGIRFSEVDSTKKMTMLEFLKKFYFSASLYFVLSCCSLITKSNRAFYRFSILETKNRTSASKDVDVLLIKFLVSSKFSKSRSSSPLPASP